MAAATNFGLARKILSQRRNDMVVYPARTAGTFYVFREKEKKPDGSINFKCRKCGKKHITVRDGHIYSRTDPALGHAVPCDPVPAAEIEQEQACREMCRDVRDTGRQGHAAFMDMTRSLPQRFGDDLDLYDQVTRLWRPFSSVDRRLRFNRQAACIPVPDPLNLPLELQRTLRGNTLPPAHQHHRERWLLHSGQPTRQGRLLIFASDDELRALHGTVYIIADGNFKIAPDPSYQVYTILGYINGEGVSLATALLPDKTNATYREMWSALKTEVEAR